VIRLAARLHDARNRRHHEPRADGGQVVGRAFGIQVFNEPQLQARFAVPLLMLQVLPHRMLRIVVSNQLHGGSDHALAANVHSLRLQPCSELNVVVIGPLLGQQVVPPRRPAAELNHLRELIPAHQSSQFRRHTQRGHNVEFVADVAVATFTQLTPPVLGLDDSESPPVHLPSDSDPEPPTLA